ncbi:Oidioi.mRNA.OKI2018_I69.chr2.g7464.t1.cds [Oikopleura dioica]|uniref:Oidioi.mRNA.OKI2018_I69.chr2.g7464.t1.cds n=1 Tax=Oikopleura dioica TaxID=34765 RepID=A0ABN7TCQ8_OIKDI|nr:Oidioi.mRNA.OKI2018_I69.chr2.g7464.t1.cds [Oikopleura dioica]
MLFYSKTIKKPRKIAFKLISKDNEVEALQIIPRAATFDQREIFDRIVKAVTWKKLVSSVVKRNRLLLSHCEVSQMLLWTATPENLRKLTMDEYRWIKNEAIIQGFIDPLVQMLFRDNKFDEIKVKVTFLHILWMLF